MLSKVQFHPSICRQSTQKPSMGRNSFLKNVLHELMSIHFPFKRAIFHLHKTFHSSEQFSKDVLLNATFSHPFSFQACNFPSTQNLPWFGTVFKRRTARIRAIHFPYKRAISNLHKTFHGSEQFSKDVLLECIYVQAM
jgi:hypothetical protein